MKKEYYKNWVKNNPEKRKKSTMRYEEKRKIKRKQIREEMEANKYF